MTVAFGTTWQPSPGRIQEVIAHMSRAKSIHKRVGADVRAFQSTAAGAATGQILYLMEFPSAEAFGTALQALQADTEWQAFLGEVNTASPSATMVNQGLAQVIPELDGMGVDPGTPGPRVRMTYLLRPLPGRGEDTLALLAKIKPVYEAEGARVRTVQFILNGEYTTNLIGAVELDNPAAWGRFQDRVSVSAEFQEKVLAAVSAADAPFELVRAGMGIEVPI